MILATPYIDREEKAMNNQGTGQYPLNNLAYDVITMLYEKSKALEAYDKYLKDAQGDQEIAKVFETMRNQDTKQIEELKGHLGRLLGSENSMSQGS
jgi:hypothetical protein